MENDVGNKMMFVIVDFVYIPASAKQFPHLIKKSHVLRFIFCLFLTGAQMIFFILNVIEGIGILMTFKPFLISNHY